KLFLEAIMKKLVAATLFGLFVLILTGCSPSIEGLWVTSAGDNVAFYEDSKVCLINYSGLMNMNICADYEITDDDELKIGSFQLDDFWGKNQLTGTFSYSIKNDVLTLNNDNGEFELFKV